MRASHSRALYVSTSICLVLVASLLFCRKGPPTRSIRVSWAVPASGATVLGYRIYYNEGANMGSVDVSTRQQLNVPLPTKLPELFHNSSHLPSTVVGPTLVIVGKQKSACFTALCIHQEHMMSSYLEVNMYIPLLFSSKQTYHPLPLLSHREQPLLHLL